MIRALSLLLIACSGPATPQIVTRTPEGPLHVNGPALIDGAGRPVLLRGTQVPQLSGSLSDFGKSVAGYGPLSATTLNAIRLRWNMNVIRLPVDVMRYLSEPSYSSYLEKAVRNANRQDLLVILAAHEPGTDMPSELTLAFWTECAARFKDNPRVLFDVYSTPRASAAPADWQFWLNGGVFEGRKIPGMQQLADAIRSAGAMQPIIVMGFVDEPLLNGLAPDLLVRGANIIYETSPHFNATETDSQRDRFFGFLARSVPVLVNDWDLDLDKPDDCLKLPQDPGVVERKVQ